MGGGGGQGGEEGGEEGEEEEEEREADVVWVGCTDHLLFFFFLNVL